jgi:hypothetical protein
MKQLTIIFLDDRENLILNFPASVSYDFLNKLAEGIFEADQVHNVIVDWSESRAEKRVEAKLATGDPDPTGTFNYDG